MSDSKYKIIFDAQDKTSKAFNAVSSNLNKLEGTFKSMRNYGGIAFGALSAGIGKLAIDSANNERVAITFDKLAESINATPKAMDNMRTATLGLVSDVDIMKASNKFMAMGLAETEDDMSKLSNMAVRLGSAMGTGATQSMEDFALMLANQSIPRLDTFGISSGKVRERILQLMEANEGMTRETAFMTAVMEQGNKSLDKLGEVTLTTGEKFQGAKAKMANMKQELGEAFIPVLTELVEKVTPVIEKITEWISKNPELTAKIGLLATALAGTVAVIGTLGLALAGFGAVLAVVTSPVTLIIGAIAGLTAGMIYLYNNSENAKIIMDSFAQVMTWIGKTVFSLFKLQLDIVISTFTTFWQVGKSVWSFLQDSFIATINWFTESWISLKEVVSNTANAFNYVAVIIGGAVNSTIEVFYGYIKSTYDLLKVFAGYLRDGFVKAWDFVTDAIDGVLDKVERLWKAIKNVAKSVSSLFGGDDGGSNAVQSFSTGGTVQGGNIGDPVMVKAHVGEKIIPYSQAGGVGGGVTVNINGGMYLDEQGADMIGNMILERVGSHLIV